LKSKDDRDVVMVDLHAE